MPDIHVISKGAAWCAPAAAVLALLVAATGCEPLARPAAAASCRLPSTVAAAVPAAAAQGSGAAITVPTRRLALTAKRNADVDEVEAMLRDLLRPTASRDPRVGNVSVFSDDERYVVVIDVRTFDALDANLVLDILGAGSSPDKAQARLDALLKRFDVGSAGALSFRPDLSLQRDVFAIAKTEEK